MCYKARRFFLSTTQIYRKFIICKILMQFYIKKIHNMFLPLRIRQDSTKNTSSHTGIQRLRASLFSLRYA